MAEDDRPDAEGAASGDGESGLGVFTFAAAAHRLVRMRNLLAPNCPATARSGLPAAHDNTMRARKTARCSELFLAMTRSNTLRSDSLRMTWQRAGFIPSNAPYRFFNV